MEDKSLTYIIRSLSAQGNLETFSGAGYVNAGTLTITKVDKGLLKVGNSINIGNVSQSVTITAFGTATAQNSLGTFTISAAISTPNFVGSITTTGILTVTAGNVYSNQSLLGSVATNSMILPYQRPHVTFNGSIATFYGNKVLTVTSVSSGDLNCLYPSIGSQSFFMTTDYPNAMSAGTQIISQFDQTFTFYGKIIDSYCVIQSITDAQGASIPQIISGTWGAGMTFTAPGLMAGVISNRNLFTTTNLKGYISGTTLTITQNTGSVMYGLPIEGDGVTPGTVVVDLITGSGNTGTYLINISQTVGTSVSPITLKPQISFQIDDGGTGLAAVGSPGNYVLITGKYGSAKGTGTHLVSNTGSLPASTIYGVNDITIPVAYGGAGIYKVYPLPAANIPSTTFFYEQGVSFSNLITNIPSNDLLYRLNGLPSRHTQFKCEVVSFMVSLKSGDITSNVIELRANGMDVIDGKDNLNSGLKTIAWTNLNQTYPQSTYTFTCGNFNGRTIQLQMYDEYNQLISTSRPYILVLKMTPINPI